MDLAEVPGVHDMDRYELLKDIGSGNFGVARLMRDKKTRELVAVKYIERGEKVGGGNVLSLMFIVSLLVWGLSFRCPAFVKAV
jgi:hypothetical protein